MQYETKTNLKRQLFVNFMKMKTAARNVNDKYIDPVKFGRLSVERTNKFRDFRQDEDQKLVTTRYCYKGRNATLLSL